MVSFSSSSKLLAAYIMANAKANKRPKKTSGTNNSSNAMACTKLQYVGSI